MQRFFIKTPWIAKKFFPDYIWSIPANDKSIYLSFDDGPHPRITPWVLELLKQHNSLATFFCLGSNVEMYPDVYKRIIDEGHAVGNHSWSHYNGWYTPNEVYLNDVAKAVPLINSNLFRPPYGRIKTAQAKAIPSAMKREDAKLIMWDVLSGDFDTSYSRSRCLKNVMKNYEPGSIIVFHDSEKAFMNLEYVLPKLLVRLEEEGYKCRKIEM